MVNYSSPVLTDFSVAEHVGTDRAASRDGFRSCRLPEQIAGAARIHPTQDDVGAGRDAVNALAGLRAEVPTACCS